MVKSVLVVIPARGGSKGIPRKNLRPLSGIPLLLYSIEMAKRSIHKPTICVSSDDQEILALAEKHQIYVVKRPSKFSSDDVTLDPVIFHALMEMQTKLKIIFDIIVTVQPTSPLLETASFDTALNLMIASPDIDTIISAKIDSHLSWRLDGVSYVPNFSKRLNRQQLNPEFRETGGFLISRASMVSSETRIGGNVSLYTLSSPETIDIDSYDDWNLCEYHLRRKKILFVVSGYPEIGLGHVYNTLIIANEILEHDVRFLVDSTSKLAYDKISYYNYPVDIQKSEDLIQDIIKFHPDVIINDRLDTDECYVASLKKFVGKVINFEDLGSGAKYADVVFNAIYPEKIPRANHYYGHKYIVLRDEFMNSPRKQVVHQVNNVLITFGGVDPSNNTQKVLKAIYNECKKRRITITVIVGFGYDSIESISNYLNIEIVRDVSDMAKYIYNADIVFTSAGRTTYEIAAINTPAIVLAQNERELTHFFASAEYGFVNMGLGKENSCMAICEVFCSLIEDEAGRKSMSKLMLNSGVRDSKRQVIDIIKQAIEEK